ARHGRVPAGEGRRMRERTSKAMAASAGQRGQALLLALGGTLALLAAALALVAIAGAVTGKGRAQRAADLVAISAVRSMRDDLTRLLAPPTLPGRPPDSARM